MEPRRAPRPQPGSGQRRSSERSAGGPIARAGMLRCTGSLKLVEWRFVGASPPKRCKVACAPRTNRSARVASCSVPRVMQVFQPAVGGVPTYVSALARGLADRNWDVIVAGPADAVGMDELRHIGIRTAPIDAQRGPQPRRDRALAHELASLAEQEDVDLVHGHSSKASVLAALASRRADVASVYTPHAWSFQMRHPLLVRAALAGDRGCSDSYARRRYRSLRCRSS